MGIWFPSTAPFRAAAARAAIVVAAATAFIALWWDAAWRRWSAGLGFALTEIFWLLEQMIVEASRWALVWRLWRATTLPAASTTHYILISLWVVIAIIDAFATHFLLITIRTYVCEACKRACVLCYSQIRFISPLALLEKRTLSKKHTRKIRFVKTNQFTTDKCSINCNCYSFTFICAYSCIDAYVYACTCAEKIDKIHKIS